MKKIYAYLFSGALLLSMASCSSENTTGVDTETTTTDVNEQLNMPEEDTMTEENMSPMDTTGSQSPTGTMESEQ